MKIFTDPRSRRLIRLIGTPVALVAALWHSTHALAMWRQMQQWKTSDPSLSDFFWAQFQTELAVSVAAFFAGVFAWHLFKPREAAAPQREDASVIAS